jgi:hypothetical protein
LFFISSFAEISNAGGDSLLPDGVFGKFQNADLAGC